MSPPRRGVDTEGRSSGREFLGRLLAPPRAMDVIPIESKRLAAPSPGESTASPLTTSPPVPTLAAGD